MKNGLAVMMTVFVLTVVGCDVADQAKAPEGLDAMLAKAVQDPQIEGAIIAQHTLYPYHFIADSPVLNELGQRDLAVLAEHFKDKTGEVNVHRGSAPEDLYKARVAVVAQTLAKDGVGPSRVQIADKLPGGDGLSSEKVLKVLERESQAAGSSSSSGYMFPATR
jgi:hypothetical protein